MLYYIAKKIRKQTRDSDRHNRNAYSVLYPKLYLNRLFNYLISYLIYVAGSVATSRYADDTDDSKSRYYEESSDRCDTYWPSRVVFAYKRHTQNRQRLVYVPG